jgi:hypothetical protein
MKCNRFARYLELLVFTFASVLYVRAQQDTNPPVLIGFDFSPKQADTTSSDVAIAFTGHVTDNLSGELSGWTVLAQSPTAQQKVASSMTLVSGNGLDGFYEGTLTLPAHSEAGTWTITQVHLFDAAGNSSFYAANDLQALGLPWALTNVIRSPYTVVVRQPINADGSSVFKANSGVIPVKFTLNQNNVPTCTLPAARIALSRTAGGTLGALDESIYSMQADTGSSFRVAGCQYIYNLAASSLGAGMYRVDISIDGSVVGNAVFALK